MTDDLRGAIEELRAIAVDIRKPSPQWWQYAVIICGMLTLAGGCVAYVDWTGRDKVSKAEHDRTLARVAALEKLAMQREHDNQILYFLVAITSAQDNATKAKINRDMNAYKKANGLR